MFFFPLYQNDHLIYHRFIWGGILMCHAATTNFTGLMCARFFLGVGEAAIAPGFTLLIGMFYKREEQPIRYAQTQFTNVFISCNHYL